MARKPLPSCDWKAFPSAASEASLFAQTTAVALCMVGREVPANINKVVRELNVEPTPSACERYLVARGVNVHTVCPFELSAFAKAKDSLAFIRAYYQPRGVWTKKWEAHWAHEAPSFQVGARESLQLLQSKRNYSMETRETSPEEVAAALDGTQVVQVMLKLYGSRRTELAMHPIVIREWQPKQRQFLCYDPDCGFAIRVMSLKEFCKDWLSEEGMITLSP